MMTCRNMGGMCDAEILGATSEEMVMKGMQHLEVAHPEMAAQIKSMPSTDPMLVSWKEKFEQDFVAAKEI